MTKIAKGKGALRSKRIPRDIDTHTSVTTHAMASANACFYDEQENRSISYEAHGVER